MAKATNALLELHDDSPLLFADPRRDYFYLTKLLDSQHISSGIRLSVSSSSGENLVLDIRFQAPEVMRVRLYRPGEEPPLASPMLVEEKRGTTAVAVTAGAGEITLKTASLEVRIVREPFHYVILDSSGRKMFAQQVADLSFLDYVAFPMGYSQDSDGRVAFHESFELEPDEHLFGLGEQYGRLDKQGQRVIGWSREAMGVNTTNLTYHNIPFFLSSRGYGIFVHHTSKIIYELGFPSSISGSFRVDDPYLDYFFIYGPSPKQILARYADLTGHAPLPPLWSFGLWMSRCVYRSRQQIEEVISKMRELGIPMDVVNIDPTWLAHMKGHQRPACDFEWDDEAFPEPEEFVRWLAERGVKLCLWENPYVFNDTEMYREGAAKGYFARVPDGEPAPSMENPPQVENVVLDFTNPEAVRWWQEKHLRYLRMGVAAFKTDFGEGAPVDALYADGRDGTKVHNVFPLLYNRAVFETVRKERGEGIVWARSGYAGSQRYPVHWLGDTQCTFGGMAGALRGGLSLSMSGIPFWSHDIGGFFNPGRFRDPPDRDLYIRWAQWGLLSSHSRFHGLHPREPWHYGDEALRVVREFARLRYRLLPYLWACAAEASRDLTPVVRPMYLEFPDDPITPALQAQYMLGPSLLVAPVLNEEGRCRVYLPEGRWYDFWSNAIFDGPKHLDLSVPIDRVPIFVRQDSVLPFAPDQDFVDQKPWNPLTLDLRLTSRATLDLTTPEGPVRLMARRERRKVDVNIEGSGQRLRIRLLDPKAAQEVKYSPQLRDARWRQARGYVAIDFELRGRARLEVVMQE
jgi:alpha-D-xyloside xylohydrolase